MAGNYHSVWHGFCGPVKAVALGGPDEVKDLTLSLLALALILAGLSQAQQEHNQK